MRGRPYQSQQLRRLSVCPSSRGAALILLVAVAFLSGVGSSPHADSAGHLGTHAHAGSDGSHAPTLDVVESKAPLSHGFPDLDAGAPALPGQVIAEFPPIDIDALPLHDASPQPLGHERQPRDDQSVLVVTKGTLASGQSLSVALRRHGISASTVYLVAQEMRPVFNFRYSQPGDRYRLAQDPEGNLLAFRYSNSPIESLYLYWNGEDYVVRRERTELEPRIVSLRGVVETSLYRAIRDLGERPQLANGFTDIFAWDIDFARNVKAGDEFQILYEKLYRTDDDGVEAYVRPGRILAARYTGVAGGHTAVYYEREGSPGRYLRADGGGIERQFLVAPLQYSRISSSFTRSSHHPILKISRPHRGIDYVAAEGSPVWSVADGVVVYRSRAGASGNLIKIRHRDGYVSYYAHLSRFADGLEIGQRVEQKSVIGYVGQTGLATGPHVCFRIAKNGRYVNPMSLESPAGDPMAAETRADFERVRDSLLAAFDNGDRSASDEVLLAQISHRVATDGSSPSGRASESAESSRPAASDDPDAEPASIGAATPPVSSGPMEREGSSP